MRSWCYQKCPTTKRAQYPECKKPHHQQEGDDCKCTYTHGWAKDENSTERERQVPSRSMVQITCGASHSGGFTRDETWQCSLEQLEPTPQDKELHTSHILGSTRLALPICTLFLLKFLQRTQFVKMFHILRSHTKVLDVCETDMLNGY